MPRKPIGTPPVLAQSAVVTPSMTRSGCIILRRPRERFLECGSRICEVNERDAARNFHWFVTAAYLIIDGTSGLIRYAAARHAHPTPCAPLWAYSRLETNGFALGFIPDADYEELEQPLESGDRLLLYTDGLKDCALGTDTGGPLRTAGTRSLTSSQRPLPISSKDTPHGSQKYE
jgi:hypothetical protein